MKIKTKLIIIASISIVVISFLSLYVMKTSYENYKKAVKIEEVVELSDDISFLVHTLQIERGLSSNYLFFSSEMVKEKLDTSRKNVDIQIDKLKNRLSNKNMILFVNSINEKLEEKRQIIDIGGSDVMELLDFYTKINNELLSYLIELSKYSNNSDVTNKLIAYTNLLLLKDKVGIERALASILATWNYSDDMVYRIKEIIYAEKIYEENFYFYATDENKKKFDLIKDNEHSKKVDEIRESILMIKDKDRNEELSMLYFNFYSKKIDVFYNGNKVYIKELESNVKKYKQNLKQEFIYLLTISSISILSFVILLFLVHQRIISSINSFKLGIKSFFEYLNHNKNNINLLDESHNDEFADVSRMVNSNILAIKNKFDEDKAILSEAIIILKDFERGKLYKRLDVNISNPVLNNLKNILNQMASNLEITIEELEHTNVEYEAAIENLNETQEYLVHSEKMASLGALVAGVAHEINTPIGIGITGSTHLVEITKNLKYKFENDLMSEEKFKDYLKSSLELSNLININLSKSANLIQSFKQIAVDQTSEEKRNFLLNEYINEVILSMNNILKKAKVKVEIRCDKNIKISSYPGLISQILTNFIMNSIIHGYKEEENKDIFIGVILEKNEIILTYKDKGKGIKENNINKIFDPFFTTNRENGGSGLGLNIIYNIVKKQLNGSINCKSKLNQGVEFTIIFKT